jgi:hypothetical protein
VGEEAREVVMIVILTGVFWGGNNLLHNPRTNNNRNNSSVPIHLAAGKVTSAGGWVGSKFFFSGRRCQVGQLQSKVALRSLATRSPVE